MPNGFLPPSVNQSDGMILLGDAMNMRHPLTGGKWFPVIYRNRMFILGFVGGMTVAFNDVVLLKEYLSHENVPSFADSEVILQKLNEFHWKRKNYCTAINVLAMALYRLFAADEGKSRQR